MTKVPLISIVDDDAALRASLANLIRSLGFKTKEFSSAESFLRSVEAPETACLILDVRMPSMNGPVLQRHLLGTKWNISIIFMTAFADEEVRAQTMAAGAVDFLCKPFSEEQLLNAIDKAIRHHDSTIIG